MLKTSYMGGENKFISAKCMCAKQI